MSHYQRGKIDLKCSVGVLRQALAKVVPEWENHIASDVNGRYGLKAYYAADNKDSGYHLVVPGRSGDASRPEGLVDYKDVQRLIKSGMSEQEAIKAAKHVFTPTECRNSYGDIGFMRNSDGSWTIDLDRDGVHLPGLSGFNGSSVDERMSNAIAQTVAKMRLRKLIAEQSAKGLVTNFEERTEGNYEIFEFDVDVDIVQALM